MRYTRRNELFFFLISVGGKHLRKLTLQYGEIPQLNLPWKITLYKEALEDKYWDPSKAGSGENHRQNHRCRNGRVRCACSFKIPVHNAKGLSGGVETARSCDVCEEHTITQQTKDFYLHQYVFKSRT